MANPVNRTLIACSVSALALAIVTLCYWKLRKRRLVVCQGSQGTAAITATQTAGQPTQSQQQQRSTAPEPETETETTVSSNSNKASVKMSLSGDEIDAPVTVATLCEQLSSLKIDKDARQSKPVKSAPAKAEVKVEAEPKESKSKAKAEPEPKESKSKAESSSLARQPSTEAKAEAEPKVLKSNDESSVRQPTAEAEAEPKESSQQSPEVEADAEPKESKSNAESRQQSPEVEADAEPRDSKSNGESNSSSRQQSPEADKSSDKDAKSEAKSGAKPQAKDEPKKAPRTFTNRRPNTTFAQALSAKAGSAAENGTPASQPEMSIDAYQNYPDSPAQNSQCSPMSEMSDRQSLHSSDSGAGSDSHHSSSAPVSAPAPKRHNSGGGFNGHAHNKGHQHHSSSQGPKGQAPVPQAPSPMLNGGSMEEICYQFNVPFDLCGQLIGAKGHFINSVKNQSHTNCVISSEAIDALGTKTCSIYGPQESVTRALNIIRNRFPFEEYPEMTLAQTNVVQVPTVELKTSCNLTLLPEILNDAILSCSITPGHIFVQQPTHPTHPNLSQLDYLMKRNYSQPNVPGVPTAVPGMICVVQNEGNWFRACVKTVSPSGHECGILFVDYGGYATVPVSSLKQIKVEFLNLPFQACECYLFNVAPVDDFNDWSAEAYNYFFEELTNKLIHVRIVELAEDQVPLVQVIKGLDNNQTVCINSELVKRGYAKWIDKSRAFE